MERHRCQTKFIEWDDTELKNDMKTSDFYYDLPQELIAQTPIEPRDASRLMVMNRRTGALEHRHFRDLVEYLEQRAE